MIKLFGIRVTPTELAVYAIMLFIGAILSWYLAEDIVNAHSKCVAECVAWNVAHNSTCVC